MIKKFNGSPIKTMFDGRSAFCNSFYGGKNNLSARENESKINYCLVHKFEFLEVFDK